MGLCEYRGVVIDLGIPRVPNRWFLQRGRSNHFVLLVFASNHPSTVHAGQAPLAEQKLAWLSLDQQQECSSLVPAACMHQHADRLSSQPAPVAPWQGCPCRRAGTSTSATAWAAGVVRLPPLGSRGRPAEAAQSRCRPGTVAAAARTCRSVCCRRCPTCCPSSTPWATAASCFSSTP